MMRRSVRVGAGRGLWCGWEEWSAIPPHRTCHMRDPQVGRLDVVASTGVVYGVCVTFCLVSACVGVSP
jgi:hypothetical protein